MVDHEHRRPVRLDEAAPEPGHPEFRIEAEADVATAAALGVKRVALVDPRRAERATGARVGAISPIGIRGVRRLLLDASAAGHSTVLVSGGRRGLEVELDPADLARVCEALVVAIART